MDGDLQNDPSDISMMIQTLEDKDCDVVTGIRQNFLQKPIYLFGSAGMGLFTIGCLINLYLLIIKLMGAEIWRQPLLLLGIMLLLIGAQFFMIGLVLDLQMRT